MMVTAPGRTRILAAATAAILLLSACAGETVDTTSTSETIAEQEPTTTTTTSPAPTTTSTEPPPPPAPSADDTSRENAAPVGATVQIGDWRVRVISVTPDATDEVLEDDFNEPPGEGEQYFIARLEATYTGTEIGDFFFDLTTSSVGESAVAYDSAGASCGLPPDDINLAGEVFPGGTIFGNVCWKIQSADAQSMVLILDEFGSFDDNRAFLALDPGASVVDDTTSIGPARINDSDIVSYGETETVHDWDIRVVDVMPNANEAILAEAGFNEDPRPDHQFFIVNVEGTYTGDGSGRLWNELTFEAVGTEGVIYSPFNADCGFVPDGLAFTSEAFPGGTVSGNVCWEIRTSDLESLVMLAREFTAGEVPRAMFSLSG